MIQLPIKGTIQLLILLVPPEGLEPSWSEQKACCPTNLATDPLGNQHSTIALIPSWGPTCSRTTTCNCFCRPLFGRRKRLECRQLLFESRMVSSLYCRLEQAAAFPVWKTLESHTRLVLIHCAHIWWWTGTHPSCSSGSSLLSES